ncbi:conserved hypothetical protein [Tenacibaculum maritimum]|uniref:hypothetical protein n=1 Tax=Tenacibaculum maritimum TaxID=107401 RepID=UPI0012E57EBA|nr:hypothetical protein [Tenacibaculum maritimum]CAA0193627.1 conserved hypothetical protein [Tenacibaculum maritimum]
MIKSKSRSLNVVDRKLLWGASGGICAKCKESIIDFDKKEHFAHEAHIIARSAKNLPSYEDLPYNLKDIYQNLLLLCGACHNETKNWSKEDLKELKKKHELYVSDTLRGHFRPIEIGKGKFFNYPFITYKKHHKPFNETIGKLNLIFTIIGVISFNAIFLFLPIIKKYDQTSFYLSLITMNIFGVFLFIKFIKELKAKKPVPFYKGKCIFVGCDGDVLVKESNKDIKNKYPFLGICNMDSSHTFTVSLDFKRGNYEKIEIIHITLTN